MCSVAKWLKQGFRPVRVNALSNVRTQRGIASPVFAEWLRGQLIGMSDVNDDLMRQGRLHNNHLTRPALKILKDLGNQLETGASNSFIKRTSAKSTFLFGQTLCFRLGRKNQHSSRQRRRQQQTHQGLAHEPRFGDNRTMMLILRLYDCACCCVFALL